VETWALWRVGEQSPAQLVSVSAQLYSCRALHTLHHTSRILFAVLDPNQLQRPRVLGTGDIGLGFGFRGLEMHQHIIEQPDLQLFITNVGNLVLGEDALLFFVLLIALATESNHSFGDQHTMRLNQTLQQQQA
jgi:hypothetical protein